MIEFYNNIVWCNIEDLVEEIADTPEERSFAHNAQDWILNMDAKTFVRMFGSSL